MATAAFLVFYTLVTYAHSDSVYFSNYYFESWTSWNIYLKTIAPTIIILILPVTQKDGEIGFWIVDCLIFLYSAFSIYKDSRIPYLNMVVNISFLITDFYFFFLAIYRIFPYLYTSLVSSINIGFMIGLLVVSVPCAEMLVNWRSSKLNKLLIKVIEDAEDSFEERASLKLENPANMNKSKNKSKDNDNSENDELDDIDEDVDEEQVKFASYIAHKQESILLLRHLLMNKNQSIEFAKFLFSTSSNINIWFNSVRFLVLRKSITNIDAQKILQRNKESIPFLTKQAFCDAQYESVGLKLDQRSVKRFFDQLDTIQNSIIQILKGISNSIRPKNEKATHNYIVQYSKACKDYELQSLIFLAHAPNCSLLANKLCQYYYKLRGDFIQGQLWQQKAESLNMTLFETPRSRSKSSFSPITRSNDTISMNRIKSQTVVQRIKSKSVISSSILYSIMAVVLIFAAFYRYKTSNLSYIMSEVVPLSLIRISSYSIITISAQMNYSLQILSSCYPEFNSTIQEINNTFLWPSINTVDSLSTLMQNISNCVSNLDRDVNGAAQAIDIWANPESDSVSGRSLQFQVVMLNMIASLLKPGQCTRESFDYIEEFSNVTRSMVTPMKTLHASILVFCDSVFKNFLIGYEIFSGCVIAVISILVIAIISVSTKFTHKERRNFWKVFQDVNESDLDEFDEILEQNKSSNEDLIEDISKYKIPKYHPHNTAPFVLYSIALLLITALILFIMIIPYRLMKTRFYEVHYDLENIDYIGQKIITLASFAPVLYIYKGEPYLSQWTSTLSITNYDTVAKLPENQKNLSQILEYLDILMGYCREYEDSNFSREDLLLNIVRLAFHDSCQISYQNTGNGYESIKDTYIIYNSASHAIAMCLTVLTLIYSIIFIIRVKTYFNEFRSMKSVLMLLPSPYASTIANLIARFDSSGSKSNYSAKFQSRYIIKQSLDAIIVLDTSKRIQDVNKSTIEMLGYSRDQLIGEPIENFISRNEESDQQATDFFSQFNFINRQTTSAPRYNLHIICSNMNLTPVSCTFLVISSEEVLTEEDGDKPAFALVLRDRTEFTEQEKKLQDANRTVELLLYRILPRVMANKLLSKATVLHSKVDRATIIFIAIVNFLDWCRMHSHTEIMELLDVIFTKFDRCISKYPTLVKLKIINGVYMCAGGLFDEVSNFSHEIEAVQFAIKCGNSVKKRNMLTKSNLQLQIGINTGGPIIAGILGSDKPLFDIWGDAVNVSARLETSAPYDTIQMSQETKESLPEGKYKLIEREKVFLKGKGEATTYVLDLHDPYIDGHESDPLTDADI